MLIKVVCISYFTLCGVMNFVGTVKRSNKRQLKLLRGSERDLKLDIASAQASNHSVTRKSEQDNWNGSYEPKTPSYSIESCKRLVIH